MAKSKSVTMTAGKIKSSYDLKGKTTLNIVDNYSTGVNADSYLSQFVKSIDASGNNLILNCEDTKGEYKITLKNCKTLATIKVSLNNDSYSYTGDSLNTFLYTYKNDITKYNKKLTVTGSFLDDTIDFSDESLYVPTAANLKKNKGLTINAGDGADTITGTKYNDTITGGAGVNTVNIDVTKNFGNDTYKLTKGEKLNIVTNGDITYKKDSKGNVVITAESTGQSKYGIIKISNLTYTGWTTSYDSTTDKTTVHFAGCYFADSTGFPDSYSESDVKDLYLNGDVRTQLETQANHYFEVQLDSNGEIVDINFLGSYTAEQSTAETTFLNGLDFSKIGTIYGNTQDDPTVESETTGTLTITGLAKKDITQGVTINGEAIVFDFDKDNVSKNKITGTAQNDEIDISDLDGLTKTVGKGKNKQTVDKTSEDAGITINSGTGNDTITGSKYSDTINSGDGNDTINGSLGNDIITGGKGDNKFYYTGGNDTIKLTKGENLTIIDDTEWSGIKTDKNDLLFYYQNDEGKIVKSIRIKDFAKTNVVGANGSIKLNTTGTEHYYDLNTAQLLAYGKDDFKLDNRKKTATLTGSRLSETITDDTSLNGYTKTITTGNGNNTVRVSSSGKVTVNGGSGVDDIRIEGQGTHIVKTGNGENVVTVTGKGTLDITGGAGEDSINVFNNDSDTKINAGNGKNIIYIQGTTGKNTVTTGSGADIITLATNADGITSTVNAGNGQNTIGFEGKGNNTIISGKDNDTINVWTGTTNTTIKAGKGENTINIANGSTFGNITLAEEKVNAKNIINFRAEINENYTLIKSGNDLIIQNDSEDANNSKIKIQGYYLTRTSKTKYADIELKIDGTVKTVDELLSLTGKGMTIGGSGTIVGTQNADNILANDYDTTLKASNDTITAGKGNDTINAGRGKNNIKFNVGDGNDTVIDGNGTDTLVFAKGVSVKAEYEDNDLIIKYGVKDSSGNVQYNDTITLNNYSTNHSVKNIKVGDKTKALSSYLPQPEVAEGLVVAGANLTQGTEKVDNLKIETTGVNRIFANAGNDNITTVNGQYATNYVYGGSGNDTITSGSGQDIIYGGSGENTIILGKGSGADYTYDENDNTFVFKDITNLNKLSFTGGSQDSIGTVADLTISGYGNSTDTLTIRNFFNLEGYDYSKIKLQAGTNGTPVSLYDLINNSDLKTTYFTGTWKSRPKAITTSPAQKAPQIDSVIYGNNPGAGSHNVLLGTAGGNNTFYSGGGNTGIAGSGAFGMTMIYGGDGDETFHCEGNKIYFNDNGTLRTYEKEKIFVINKADGTKEVKTGVFYHTALGSEQPYSTYTDYYNQTHNVYYTEDASKISQIPEDDRFGTSFVCTGNGEIVNYIKSSTGSVNGGGGNDIFYTGFGANGDDGNDTIIGSGVMYGGRGNDKFVLTDEYKDSLDPMYNVYTNSGNDYIDTTQIANGDENIHVGFGEGVNTLIVDGSRKVNISIDTTSTFREEEPVSKIIETRYSFQARNTHYTAFVQGEDLYIASNNSNKSDNEESVSYDGKGAGVLIIKGWTNLSDTQKDNITISYRELLATTNYTSSTYTIKEFLKIIDGTSTSFIAEGNGRHTYINEYGNEKINETYTFNVINNSDGSKQTTIEDINYINKDGVTQTATRNVYDGWGDYTGTEQRAVDYFIVGGNGAQTIKGGDGNDVIYGDNINGHDNNGNYISSTKNDGADTIYGGKGNDYIIGGGGADFIDGGSGTDYIDGGDGNDTLIGGTLGTPEEFNKSLLTSVFNLKEIHGGNGDDTIYSLGAYDTDGNFDAEASKTYLGGNTYFTNNIYAGDGDDIIHANGFRDVVYGGKGNDTITSYAGNNDYYYNSNATSEIYGEEGNDHIILKSHADVRAFGGDGDDIIDGRNATVTYYNMLWGDKGNDTIYGGSGKDIIYTGQGDNHVEAGDGDDEIYGSDMWLGRGGDNYIDAGAGNDYIRTSGTSTVLGGAGNDTIYFAMGYNNMPSNLYIDGGDGDDTYIADGGYGFDTIVASSGKDVIQFKGFVKANTSYTYNGDDLVLSYTNDGYPAGLILKDYKKGGFSNFTIKTYGGYDESYAQTGQYSMANFIKYLDGSYSMATTGTEGDDAISATGNVDGKGGNDFILAHSTTSTEANPQVINTGSGNNSVVAQAAYSNITGGEGNDEYNLQGSMATLVDNGGNNTVTVARQNNDNVYFDITLNGNGNNTITSANSADCCAYKITATGSGKQTIDINSAEFRNHPDTNEQLFTTVKTGSGDDEIKLYLGTVEAGEGDDTITVKNGANSGSNYTDGATLKGEEGNDTYIIEGGYDWQTENGISVNLKALIDDSQGSNTVMFTSEFMTHDNLNLLFNVQANGTLAEFKHYVNNPVTGENDIVGTGYSAFICGNKDLEYAGTVSTASYNGWDVCDGVRFANTSTLQNISKIEASDGYYISQATLSSIITNTVEWLVSTENGKTAYASVMDAISPNGNFNQDNYNALHAIFNNENTWTQGA